MNRLATLCLSALLALGLTACERDAQPGADSKSMAGDGPAEASQRVAAELKDNDVLGALQAALPPSAIERMKVEFENSRKEAPNEDERLEFAAVMAKLTADDAEAALMAELEPALQKYEAEMKAQMPLLIAMGRGFSEQWVKENPQLTETQKKQIAGLLDGVARWLGEVNFADRELARRAVSTMVQTARKLELKTLDQLQALEFEQAMAKAGVVMGGVKDVLSIYGLKIDDSLASVRASVLSQEGDSAKVKMAYRFFDQTLEVESDMVRREGRWFGKETIEGIEKQLAAAAADSAAASVEAVPADALQAPAPEAAAADADGAGDE